MEDNSFVERQRSKLVADVEEQSLDYMPVETQWWLLPVAAAVEEHMNHMIVEN